MTDESNQGGAESALENLRDRLMFLRSKLEPMDGEALKKDIQTLDDAIDLIQHLIEGTMAPPPGDGWVRFDPGSGALMTEVEGAAARIRIGIEDVQILGTPAPGKMLVLNEQCIPQWVERSGGGS